jgi:heterodisulfide reductase subunit C
MPLEQHPALEEETTAEGVVRMSAPLDNTEPVARINFEFRRALAKKIEGNLAGFCYQCGACVGDCPAATYSSDFNPREIMLKVLYGLGDELLGSESVLWHCTNCYNCHERCPQEVKPVEVIISLKNMLADRGGAPGPVDKVIRTFEETGRTTPVNPAVQRQREKYGLPPLGPVPVDEVRRLIEPAVTAESVAGPSREGEAS